MLTLGKREGLPETNYSSRLLRTKARRRPRKEKCTSGGIAGRATKHHAHRLSEVQEARPGRRLVFRRLVDAPRDSGIAPETIALKKKWASGRNWPRRNNPNRTD